MIWLTWRQSRTAVAMMGAALAALAVIVGLTGPGLADNYSEGLAACTAQGGGCSDFADRFLQDHATAGLAVTAVMMVLPALIGLFWGAPLIARELEAGTHRLVWNQSITRTRWLAVKLGLIGLITVTAVGLATVAVDWWTNPIDNAAFALGVTVGMLVRRALPAMAITLAVFVAIQIAMPQLVRPHLGAPTRSTVEITPANVGEFIFGPDRRLTVGVEDPVEGAWILSSNTVDASGNAVETIARRSLSPESGPCGPPRAGAAAQKPANPGDELAPCLAELKRLGYRQQVTYHAASRFWAFQAYETGIYIALAFALTGFCFWWLRRRIV